MAVQAAPRQSKVPRAALALSIRMVFPSVPASLPSQPSLAGLSTPLSQCGYCQAGQITTAAALLAKNLNPSDADIDNALDGNLLGHPVVGTSWEGFVIETLLSFLPWHTTAFFYRTAVGGAEIGLILEHADTSLWAIEIKRSLSPKLERGFHQARLDPNSRQRESGSPRSTNPSTASEKIDFATPRCLASSPCPSATSSLK